MTLSGACCLEPQLEPSGVQRYDRQASTATDPILARCLIVQPIHEEGIVALRRAGIDPVPASAPDMASVAAEIGACEAVITRNAGLSAEALAAAPRLRVIGVHGTGTDPVAIGAATARGIVVLNTPEANVRSVAEHAFALLLAVAKRVTAADAAARGGDRTFRYGSPTTELAELRLGLLGFGRVAKIVTGYAAAFGMEVAAVSPRQPDAAFAAAGAVRLGSAAELFGRVDAVSLHLPLTDETRGLVDSGLLSRMRPGGLFVNTGRSATVVEPDLIAALREGRLAGAGLDVVATEHMPPDHPLLALPNVILSPHLAGSSVAAMAADGDRSRGRRDRGAVRPAAAVGREPGGLAGRTALIRLAPAHRRCSRPRSCARGRHDSGRTRRRTRRAPGAGCEETESAPAQGVHTWTPFKPLKNL